MGAGPDDPAPDLPPQLRYAFERGGEMGRRMLAHDWIATPLGPSHAWPDELRNAVATMMASRAPVVIFWGPPDYCALYNDAYIPTMGSKHPEHLGRPGREMWSEAWSMIQKLFDGVVARDDAFYAENLLFELERYGFLEQTYFDVSYDPIRLDDGTVGGVFCIVSETTRRVLGERRVRTLSSLGALLADPVDEADLGARVARVLGRNRGDVPFAALYLNDIDGSPPTLVGVCGVEPEACGPPADGLREVLHGVLRTGRPAVVPIRDAVHLPPPAADDAALVLPIAAGTANVGALVVAVSRFLALDRDYRDFLDLTTAQISRAVANLRAYEQERRRAAELAALDTAKTNFFSNVSHEFRTPLTLILGPLEDLLSGPTLTAEQRERLLPMHRNGLRLLKLVNTVLDFSRLESGRMRAAYRPTDLADYTARLASTFRSAAERAGLQLVVDCPPLSAPVYVDREMWEKIVLNLLSNALKFTPTGNISVRVESGPARRPSCVISDTGVGVPPDDQPLLFERFHRVTGGWSRGHEGTGIGLALVRELAELHGGTVAMSSAPGARQHLHRDRAVRHGPPARRPGRPRGTGGGRGRRHPAGRRGAALVDREPARTTVRRRGRRSAAGCNSAGAAGSCSPTTTSTCVTMWPACCARTGR